MNIDKIITDYQLEIEDKKWVNKLVNIGNTVSATIPIAINILEKEKKLKNVLFYEGLGSLYEKTIRLSKVSKYFSSLFNVDESLAKEASLLSKFDLVSEMVREFPELQGIMGSYFTKLDGKSKEVSNAIFEHYKPKGISDEMPTTNLGGMLSTT